MAIYVELGALVAALVLLYVFYRFLKNPLLIVGNSIVGLVVLFLLNAVLGLAIPINFWSIAVVALGGLGGVLVVLLLHFLGWAF